MTYDELEQLEQYIAEEKRKLEMHGVRHQEDWMSYQQLLEEYSFPGVKSVQRADWRAKHNFYPCKIDGKGCKMRISRSLLERWLQGEKVPYKCVA